MHWKTTYDYLINLLHFAINARVEYMTRPDMGLIIIHSNERLTQKDLEPFKMELSTEKQWVPGEYVYSSCFTNEAARLVLKWGYDHYDEWTKKVKQKAA